MFRFVLRAIALLLGLIVSTGFAQASREIRLYALDCGHLVFQDLAAFSDTGEWAGKSGELAEPCFLIEHPNGLMIWDTGLGDIYAGKNEGTEIRPGVRVTMPVGLVEQLRSLKLAPADIKFVAFSHFHYDHVGNANLFGKSTWILNRAEVAAMDSPNRPYGFKPELISGYKTANVKEIEGDYDVFGDGTVTILKAPGHTPGHQALEVKLAKSGVVILSGDLYHQRRNRAERLMPIFNTSRADTLASMDRIERIVKNTRARFVIQHSLEDFTELPKFPQYLD
jgi:glyoxylase-like metal-dependent hydrolase (beta-lactamase superfamily II)